MTTHSDSLPAPRSTVYRFSAAQRFEHFVLLVAFFGLALTGLPQKYASQGWAEGLIRFWGGIESTRIIHRFLAILLLAETIYHVIAVSYRLFVLRRNPALLPRLRDVGDLRDWLLFNLGARRERPRMPHYNAINKLDYWFTAIGIVVLIVTGYMLWNPIATTNALPGEAIPVARAVHGEQALLMVILVVIWHGYNTLIRRLNGSIFTGRLARKAMAEDHAEELARIDSGEPLPEPSTEERAQRSRVFWPVAGVVTVVLLGLLYSFVTFEQTALTTVPRPEVPIFAPQVKPAEGDAKVGAALWQTVRCAICHGADGRGIPDDGPALRNTVLSFEAFYKQVRTGTDTMPSFRPEELPDAYVLHLYTWLKSAN